MTNSQSDSAKPRPSEFFDEIAGIVGHEDARKFIEVCGGARIYIPAKISATHWLSKALGFELAEKLSNHFAVSSGRRRGLAIDIPLGRHAASVKRAAMIDQLDDRGYSSREIALSLKISQRAVYRRLSARACFLTIRLPEGTSKTRATARPSTKG